MFTEDFVDHDVATDPMFGLDPHVLPQFDLLVSEGKITREFADKVIADRAAAGLPMTPSELKPRPAPIIDELAWVSRFGGPEIRGFRGDRGSLEIAGQKWSWSSYSESTQLDLTLHFLDSEGQHVGWCGISLRHGGKRLSWQKTKITDRAPSQDEPGRDDIATVTAEGYAHSFDEALEKIQSWDFAEKLVGPYVWRQTKETSWSVSALGHQTLFKISRYPEPDQMWHWEATPDKKSPLAAFLKVMNIPQLSGTANSEDEAMVAAVGAFDSVIGAAKNLVGDVDAFEAGRAAGRAELKLEISRLA